MTERIVLDQHFAENDNRDNEERTVDVMTSVANKIQEGIRFTTDRPGLNEDPKMPALD